MASSTSKKKKRTGSSLRGSSSSSSRGSSASSSRGSSASSSRGNASSRGTASSSSRGRNTSNKTPTDFRVIQEIKICIVAVIAILLLLGTLGFVGVAGKTISGALFGAFGLMAYLFPFVLFFGYAFFIANRDNSLILRKMIGLLLLFCFLCAFLQLLTLGFHKEYPIEELYLISSEDRTGGGFLGGIIVLGFGSLFGTVGAYILTAAGMIIAAIILTQRPLITEFGAKSRSAARAASKKRQENRQLRNLRRTERRKELERKKEDFEEDYVDLDDYHGSQSSSRAASKPKKKKQEFPETAKEPKTTMEDTLSFPQEPDPKAAVFAMPSFLRGKDVFSLESESLDGSEAEGPADSLDLEFHYEKEPEVSSEIPPKEELPASDPSGSPENPPTQKLKNSTPEERNRDIAEIRSEIEKAAPKKPEFKKPPATLLTKGKASRGDSRQQIMDTAAKLQQTLQNFGVDVKVVNVSRGPTVTRYELQPEMGVKVSRIVNLQDDIKLNLAASEIRIEAPIPGKAAVGIEVPNKEIAPVMLREIIDCDEFKETKAKLPFAVGKDIGGRPIITDIEKMPHLLIAGATGSGKSVCINTLIMSILYGCTPEDVRFLMIDPKVVELKIYDGIPHLLIPVVTDAKKAAGALNWAVQEMTERYNKFAEHAGVRDIRSYNEKVKKLNQKMDEADLIPTMPRIIVIVDELADLMMVASSEVEDAICRLAQLARAAGIHLIIATQRPSVNVVTGLIKANMPSRIALAVTSGTDSRTILDMNGAEKLLGKGDMLFYPQGYPKPARVQGAFVSDEDIVKVVDFLTSQADEVEYNKEVEEKISSTAETGGLTSSPSEDERDEYFLDSGRLIIEKDKASIGMLQRAFKIGFNRAARIMDQLADAGVVGGEEGTKPRKILMTMEEFEESQAAQRP